MLVNFKWVQNQYYKHATILWGILLIECHASFFEKFREIALKLL